MCIKILKIYQQLSFSSQSEKKELYSKRKVIVLTNTHTHTHNKKTLIAILGKYRRNMPF